MHAVRTVNSVCSLCCSAIHMRAPLALQCAASLDLQFTVLRCGFCRIMQLLAVCSIMHYAAGCKRAQILGQILKSRDDKDLPLLHVFFYLRVLFLGGPFIFEPSRFCPDIIFVTSSTSSASVKYFWICVKLYRINTLTTLLEGKCVKIITQDVSNCKENYTRG